MREDLDQSKGHPFQGRGGRKWKVPESHGNEGQAAAATFPSWPNPQACTPRLL